MRKGTKIAAIIAGACLGGGVLLGAVGFALGGATGLGWDGEHLRVLETGEHARRVEENMELGTLTGVVVESGSADVRFETADTYGVRLVDYDASERLSYRVEDGVLFVETDPANQGISMVMGFFTTSRTPEITVYLPEDAELETVNLDQDMGNLEIAGLSAGEMTVSLSMGDAELSGVEADSLQLESDTGDISLSGSTAGSLTMTMNLGNLELEDVAVDGTASLENDCGDITLNSCTFGNLQQLSCNLGDITAENLTADGVTLFCDTGSASLQGKLTGLITAQMNLGDLDLEIAGTREEYAITAETGLGDVRVDGEEAPGYETVTDAPNRIEVTSELGDVAVDFQ